MRVLAIGAHPDDLEILCGATLARMAAQGDDVVMAHLTDGARGGAAGTDPGQLAATRLAEAQRSAAIAGCRHVCLGIPDAGVSSASPGQLRLIVDLVRDVAPGLILAHHPDDYHPDHREASKLAFAGSFAATNPMVDGNGEAPAEVAALYYMDTLAGLGFEPAEFVDVTDFIEIKKSMMSAHASQLDYLRDTFGSDIVEHIDVVARFRGLQCHARYAEGFQAVLTWHRPRTRRLLP